MITEDYVSFESAKLLKEKGFVGECHVFYNSDGYILDRNTCGANLGDRELSEDEFLCPTIQTAMKWLREVHHIAISVYVFNRDVPLKEDNIIYTCDIATANMSSKEGHLRLVGPYEEACEAAIKYCLENLI